MLSENAPTYESAGVSLATANAVVDRLRSAVESTGATGFGHFAGLYPLDEHRFLAASTDSVGSKLLLQRRADKLRWGGMDLAAHCINDVLCSGAEPLFFLDYVAAEHIELEQVADLVEGAAEVCRRAGCMLIGGETAELPGVYREDELDFAGTCVGLVERDRVIDGSRCAPGDVIVGFPSDGIHTNGFSLVRSLVRRRRLRRRSPVDAAPPVSRRGPRAARAGRREGAGPCHRRRHPRQPVARAARRRARAPSTGTRGSDRRYSTGSPSRASRRRKRAVSSTSASACAPSCGKRPPVPR